MMVATVVTIFFVGLTASASTLGIDVSSYQGTSQAYFQSFKNTGDHVVGVKLGGRGGGELSHYVNPSAYAQIHNADAVGMQTFGYFWGEFGGNSYEAQYHAQLAVQDAKNAGLAQGSIIALDYEAGASGSVEANTTAILTFMQSVKAMGYRPILYSGYSYMQTYIDLNRVNAVFPNALWVASYPTMAHQARPNMNYMPRMSNIFGWQYSSNHFGIDASIFFGQVDGKSANKPASKPANKPAVKSKTVHFNKTFEVNYYQPWYGKWYAVSNDLTIKPTDYNNFIPLSGITMTNRNGQRLANQYAQVGYPQREYFRLNGHYKVLHNYGSTMVIEVAGEPVSIQSKYAVADK